MNQNGEKSKDDRAGHLVGGIIVFGVGLLFLLINMDILPSMRDTWPVIVIVVGIALIISGLTRKKKEEENRPN